MPPVAEESFRFFGLERDPFAPTADPAFFYFTLEFERCLFGLKKSIDSRYGIVLIFGPCPKIRDGGPEKQDDPTSP